MIQVFLTLYQSFVLRHKTIKIVTYLNGATVHYNKPETQLVWQKVESEQKTYQTSKEKQEFSCIFAIFYKQM